MRDTITKLYPKLTPQERFKLFLEALSREDREEAERLVSSCPRETYRMADAAFGDLVDASRLAAAVFCAMWLDARRRYEMAEMAVRNYLEAVSMFVRGYVQGANNAWRRAGKEGVAFDIEGREPTDEELEEIGLAAAIDGFPVSVQKAIRERAAEVKGLWEGFTRFCQAAGVDPKKILAWWPPVLEELEEAKDILNSKAPADEGKAEFIYATFCQAWPGGVGEDEEEPGAE